MNRTTEYGLMALRHMQQKHINHPFEVTSAREISDFYGLPFEITAKTLQRLRDTGLIQSAQGAKGGYLLLRPLAEVSLAEFLRMMEGPQFMVACANADDSHARECEYDHKCQIKQVMNRLNDRFLTFLSKIPLIEFTEQLAEPYTHATALPKLQLNDQDIEP